MALAVTLKFSDFIVFLRTTPPPGTLVAPCAFSSRALQRNKTFQEVIIPDCSDEDLPAWVNRDVLSMSWGVTGEGLMDEGSIIYWEEWFATSQEREVTIVISKSDETLTYIGLAHLQTLTYSANRAERLMFNVDIVGDGELVLGTSALAGATTKTKKTKEMKEAA